VVKVVKSVGAVRVYNPLNAAGVIVGLVLLVAGIGFAIGWLANNDNGSSTSSAAAPSDAAGRQAAYQSGLAAGKRQGATSAAKGTPAPRTVVKGNYTNGFKAGTASALGGIKSAGDYFVSVGRNGSGLQVGPHVTAQPGNTYWLCAGGHRICYTSGSAPSK
jgi:hypothetical protein